MTKMNIYFRHILSSLPILLLNLFLFFAVFGCSAIVHAETDVSGNINFDTTWTVAGSPYVVTGNIFIYHSTVGQTATLTIEPGVEVRFRPGTYLRTGHSGYYGRGALVAQGTPESPIIFTSDSSTPSLGDWQGLLFYSMTDSAVTLLEHCIIEYGGHSLNSNVYIDNSSPEISHNTIRHSTQYGIFVSPWGGRPNIIGNTFINTPNAVYATNDAQPQVHYNNFLSSVSFGVYNVGSVEVDARNNWWGDNKGPGFSGTAVYGLVNYSPWLAGDMSDNDPDGDAILSDGNSSGISGDALCINGQTADCDDNCPNVSNPLQYDSDDNGTGDSCENIYDTVVTEDITIDADDTAFENISLTIDGSIVTISGSHFLENISLVNGAILKHGNNSNPPVNSLDLTINGDVTTSHDSAISVDGLGYPLGTGPGAGSDDFKYPSGAGYGGTGGISSRYDGGIIYGTNSNPSDFGSGGGVRLGTVNGANRGGGGVLAIRIAGTLYNYGTISANGTGNDYSYTDGGGSGGTISLTAGDFKGDGAIIANGGSVNSDSGGGGGGRISINYYQEKPEPGDFTTLTANGGTGYGQGADGTIFIAQTGTPLISTNNGLDFTTNAQLLVLEGTCLIDVANIYINDSRDNVTYTGGTTNWSSHIPLEEGVNTFHVAAENGSGDRSGKSTITVILDTTPAGAPVITTNEGGDLNATDSAFVLAGTCDSDVTEILINGESTGVTYTPGSGEWSFTTELIIGDTLLSVTALDDIANESDADNITVTFINALADRPINLQPAYGSVNNLPTLTLESSVFVDENDGDTHRSSQWQLRTADGSYDSPRVDSGEDNLNLTTFSIPYGQLELDSIYFWRVRYRDSRGSWTTYSAESSFVTLDDQEFPETSITVGPENNSVVQNDTVAFSWSGTDNVQWNLTWSTQLDDGEWGPFSDENSQIFNNLSDGEHTISIRTRDFSNNIDPTPASRTFTVRTAPENVTELTVTSFATSLVYTWTSSIDSLGDLAGYRLYLDGSLTGINLPASQTSYEVTGLSPSVSYAFKITSVDTNSNESRGASLAGYTSLNNPTDLSAQPFSTFVALTWNPVEHSEYLKHYRIYVAEDDFNSVEGMEPVLTSINSSINVAGLTNNTDYFFGVSSVNISGGEVKGVATVTARPVPDIVGPTATNIQFGSLELVDNLALVVSNQVSLEVNDPSGVSRVEFHVDGELQHTDNSGFNGYSWWWPVENFSDGSYSLSLTLFDTLGNISILTYSITVALNAPEVPPVIYQPANNIVVNSSSLVVAGLAGINTEVILYNNGVVEGSWVAVMDDGSFNLSASLIEGNNPIQVSSRNRGGEGPLSIAHLVTLDTTIPDSPTQLEAKTASSGAIVLSWNKPYETAVLGYKLYRSTESFDSITEAEQITSSLINASQFTDLPASDGTYYYRVTSVDLASNESALSNSSSDISDRVAPRVVAIDYNPEGNHDPISGRIAPGVVNLEIEITEPLQVSPFLSINAPGSGPISVELQQISDLVYKGFFIISENAPTGDAYAVFSGRDLAGNRGTEVDRGRHILIDTIGPAVVRLDVSPLSPVRNDSESPVTLEVEIGLNERVDAAAITQLFYLLSGTERQETEILQLIETASQGEEIQAFTCFFELPWDAGLTTAEFLQFRFSSVDDLGNLGSDIGASNRVEVFQSDLPPLATPLGFSGNALSNGRLQLSWYAVDNAVSYQIYRQSPGESVLTPYQRATAGEFIDNTIEDGSYIYTVASVRQEVGLEALSAPTNALTLTADSFAADSPENLTLELTGKGILAKWQEGAHSESVTFSLYRSAATTIDTVAGLTPLATNIEQLEVIDPTPSLTEHCYVVTAVDGAGNESDPSNSFYLNVDLLPVSSLAVVLHDEESPVISWSASGTPAGYDIYLGSGGNQLHLNQELLTQQTFVDQGYSGEDRIYSIVAQDENGVKSLARFILLPEFKMTLLNGIDISLFGANLTQINEYVGDLFSEISFLSPPRRGLMNRLGYLLENRSTQNLKSLQLQVVLGGHTHLSESFNLESGEYKIVSVVVSGNSDLADLSQQKTSIIYTPNSGERVEKSHTSELIIGDGMLVAGIRNGEFTRGVSGEVSFTLENTSSEEIEIVTATYSGKAASDDIVFRLKDADDNILSVVNFKQTTGSELVTFSDGRTVARIAAGAIFTSTFIQLPVTAVAPREVVVELDIAEIHYHLGREDQARMNGVTTTKAVSMIDTSYYGEVISVSPENSFGEDHIITGQAIDRVSGEAMAHAALDLVITVKGFERSFQVYTDEEGNFNFTFTPLVDESGLYTVYAVHPDLKDRQPQATFVIQRVVIDPTTMNVNISRNYEQKLRFTVRTDEGSSLNNVRLVYVAEDQSNGTTPEGIHVALPNAIDQIGPGGSAILLTSIWADNSSESNNQLILRVISDESPSEGWAVITLNTHFSDALPILNFSPTYVETGLARNEIVSESINISNNGLADLEDINLELVLEDGRPAPAWIQFSSSPAVGTLSVGANHQIDLAFSPGNTVLEGYHTFYLRVISGNYPQTDIGLYIAVTQDGIGNVQFKVSDIYTGTLDEGDTLVEGLSGANIRVQNDIVTEVEHTLTTDSLGEVIFTDLPSGSYKCRITAPDHQEYIGRFMIKPGITINQEVFLKYDLVSVEWEVVPITIEDKYEIVLNTTFKTSVPAAVVVADPASINLPEMRTGDIYNGEFILTNHGTIQANDLQVIVPADDTYFRYELMGSVPDVIAAKEQIRIPYRVICLVSPSQEENGDGSGGGCERYTKCFDEPYSYEAACGVKDEGISRHCLVYDNGQCTNNTASQGVVPVLASGGSSGYVSSGGGGGGSVSLKPGQAPAPIEGVRCQPDPICAVSDHCCNNSTGQPSGSLVGLLRGEYKDDVEDLFVKTLGHHIDVTRYFYDHGWHFRHEAQKIEVVSDGTGTVQSLKKERLLYTPIDQTRQVFTNNDDQRILIMEGGFRWENNSGNWSEFDGNGKIVSSGDRNNVKISYIYEGDSNNRLTGIADHFDSQVLWFDYDNNSNISSVHDTEDRTVYYSYEQGRLTKVVDVLGNITSYVYDTQGRMIEKHLPSRKSYFLTYDLSGYVATVLDQDDKGLTFEYSQDLGRDEYYARVIGPTGKITEKWFNAEGDVIRQNVNGRTITETTVGERVKLFTNAAGLVTRKEYDEWDNLTKVVYPDGSSITNEYDLTLHKVNRKINEIGTVTVYEYDTMGNLLRMTEAVGTESERVVEYTYDEFGSRLTENRLADAVTVEALTVMTWDQAGNLHSLTDPEGNTTTFAYDIMGNNLTQENADGNITSSEYDNAGQLVKLIDPLGNITQSFYDSNGNIVKTVNASGRETLFTYNLDDNLITVTDPAGGDTRNEYDNDGNLLKRIDSKGRVNQYLYDNDGRLVKEIDGNGNVTESIYSDTTGCSSCSSIGSTDRIAKIKYPTFNREFSYDLRGRVTGQVDVLSEAEQQETITAYDSIGNLLSKIDAEGNIWIYEYDAIGRKIKEVDAAGIETLFAYDNRNNLISLQDGNSNITRFVYDTNNRIIQEIRPMGQETVFQYNTTGSLSATIDSLNQKAGYDYNDAGQLIAIQYYSVATDQTAEETVTYNYNSAGQLISYNDGSTSGQYTYDSNGRKTSETVNYGSFEKTYFYSYDSNGLKKSYTAADGAEYQYSYDSNNQLTAIEIPEAGLLSYDSYQWNRPVSLTFPGGTVRHFAYDSLMRIHRISDKDPGDNTVIEYQYTYNGANNIQTKSTEHGDYRYGYDPLSQLISVDNPTLANEGFTYDQGGNRKTSLDTTGEWQYDQNNALLSTGEIDFIYDDNGNMVSKTESGLTRNYFFNIENRLTRIENDDGTVIAEYSYDPFGRRLWKEVAGVRTYFFYNDEGLAAEFGADGTVIKSYGFKPNSIWTTDPVFVREGGGFYWYLNDHLGTPVKLVASNGAVVWDAVYSSFGEAVVDIATVDNKLRFPGQYLDSETDMYQNWNRSYMSHLGRYQRADPLGIEDGPNVYLYANNNPITNFDVEGLACGSGNWGDKIIPDRPAWINFTSACEYHDRCYGECEKTKKECDKNFLTLMKARCRPYLGRGTRFRYFTCRTFARIYYHAVRTHGKKPYRNAQIECFKNCIIPTMSEP